MFTLPVSNFNRAPFSWDTKLIGQTGTALPGKPEPKMTAPKTPASELPAPELPSLIRKRKKNNIDIEIRLE